MILLVDLCYEKGSLSQYEFVIPIVDTLRRAGAYCEVLHFLEIEEDKIGKYDKIILCGTALKDNAYAEHMNSFSWITGCNKLMLGICAGMQVIGFVFGGQIVPWPAIGLEKVDIIMETPLLGRSRQIDGYHLHNYGVTLPQGFQLVAGNLERVEAFKHCLRPIYGIVFHPEVRNRWILEHFANL